MFGAYDPSYNPESLEKAKAENKELSPQQQEMADKWASAMAENGVEANTAQIAAETGITTGDETAAAEIVAATQTENGEEEAPTENGEAELEEGGEEELAGTAPTGHKTTAEVGKKTDTLSPDETVANMATLTPAGAIAVDAIDQATTVVEQGLSEGAGIKQVADFVEDVAHSADGLDEEEGDQEGQNQEQEPQAPANTEIQHFSPGDSDTSSFSPLPPEEQKAQAQAITSATKPDGEALPDIGRYDGDNLVAQAVAENSGKGSIDLNSVGAKLEADGVDIGDEVDRMEADIANDVAQVGGENSARSAEAAAMLEIDAAAEALATKEKAADTAAAIKSGSETAAAAESEFTQASTELDSLIDTAESSALQAGEKPSEKIAEARKLSTEAKDAVEEAKTEAEATEAEAETETAEEEGGEEKPADEDGGDGKKHEGGDDEFNSDNYPELKDLEKGDRQSIFA